MTACEKKRPRENWRRSRNLASSFRSAALFARSQSGKEKFVPPRPPLIFPSLGGLLGKSKAPMSQLMDECCLVPLFQNESVCKTFRTKMSLIGKKHRNIDIFWWSVVHRFWWPNVVAYWHPLGGWICSLAKLFLIIGYYIFEIDFNRAQWQTKIKMNTAFIRNIFSLSKSTEILKS